MDMQELIRLHRMGTGYREVARLLAISPMTERVYRKALQQAGLLTGSPDELPSAEELNRVLAEVLPERTAPQQRSTVEAWQEEIAALRAKGNEATAIYDLLRLRHAEFQGSLSAIKRVCQRLGKTDAEQAKQVVIPVETEPGEVAQVDFGYAGEFIDGSGKLRKAWVFVMVLGYSRHMVARLVFDQKIETWLRLHREAFEELGGVPAVIVPDNLKAAVIRAAFGVDEPAELNRSYRELARHYGCKIDPTPPRSPEKKGKVESAVKYVCRNFFKPRGIMEYEAACPELATWVEQIAGQRRHGITGKQPLPCFLAEEKHTLLPLPAQPYEVIIWKQATVHTDCHVCFEGRLFSVPFTLVGSKVWIRAVGQTVELYAQELRVALHPRYGKGVRSTIETHLPEQRAALRHRSRAFWEERAKALGPEVDAYVTAIFDLDDALARLRTVQSVVTYLERFPRERARAACKRGLHYGNLSYHGLKAILTKALDLVPLEEIDHSGLERPRFARKILELVPKEVCHASAR